jgi:two-component system, chemotaxis family, response regulator Rcp1
MTAAQIVLIEDNPGDALLVQMALKESDISYEMTRFEDGEEAVNALCLPGGIAYALHPDAILLDLNTPRSDGFDVLGKLRRNPRLADVPIAIITSSHARSDKQRTTLVGSVRYIEKPSQLEEFLRTVGRAVKEMLHD